MKKFSGFLAIMAFLALFASCADDIILEEPPSLKGTYTGKYIVKILSTQQTSEENILWRFEDKFFYMNLDPDKFSGKCFCQCFGEYVLTEGVRLKVIGSQPDGEVGDCTSCNAAENPEGTFVLDQSTSTLKLTRQVGDTLKQLLLNKVTQ
jgi:hypothetical protein